MVPTRRSPFIPAPIAPISAGTQTPPPQKRPSKSPRQSHIKFFVSARAAEGFFFGCAAESVVILISQLSCGSTLILVLVLMVQTTFHALLGEKGHGMFYCSSTATTDISDVGTFEPFHPRHGCGMYPPISPTQTWRHSCSLFAE